MPTLILLGETDRVVFPADKDLFNVVKAMLEHYLAELSIEERVEILDKRMTWEDESDPRLRDNVG